MRISRFYPCPIAHNRKRFCEVFAGLNICLIEGIILLIMIFYKNYVGSNIPSSHTSPGNVAGLKSAVQEPRGVQRCGARLTAKMRGKTGAVKPVYHYLLTYRQEKFSVIT